jgi:hypothetical protein
MNVELRPLSELNQHATAILVREIGLVDTLRFLSQFSAGSGDYTKERGQWLDELSLKQITSEIKVRKHKHA